MDIIKVLLVDNEEVFRDGLVKLLGDQPHIEVVYHCGGGKEAIEKGSITNPDVILVSQSSDYDVSEFVKEVILHSPEMKVAVIGRQGEAGPLKALKSGAKAYLARNITAADLVNSIELISSGRLIISPAFADKFINELASTDESIQAAVEKPPLSERELEIVQLIIEGNTNKEIARKLFIAENTVKAHVKNILGKLELRNRQQLAAVAVLNNWIAGNRKKEEQPT